MDFKAQTNQQPQPQPSAPQPAAPRSEAISQVAPTGSGGSGGRKLIALVVGLVVVAIIAVVGVLLWQGSQSGETTETTSVDTSKYQAVFMTNGQVYFGKLSNLDSKYSELTDVYYLQVQQQNIQPGTGGNTTNSEQPQVSLTKLGQELHGPTDKMHIASEQILFWEDLKDDSTVVKAIKDYQAKQ